MCVYGLNAVILWFFGGVGLNPNSMVNDTDWERIACEEVGEEKARKKCLHYQFSFHYHSYMVVLSLCVHGDLLSVSYWFLAKLYIICIELPHRLLTIATFLHRNGFIAIVSIYGTTNITYTLRLNHTLAITLQREMRLFVLCFFVVYFIETKWRRGPCRRKNAAPNDFSVWIVSASSYFMSSISVWANSLC